MPFSVPLCSTVEETAQKVYQKVTKKVDRNLENDAKNGSEPINNADSNSSSNNADGDNLDGQPGILNSVPLCSTVEETAKKVYQKVTKKVDKNLENDVKNGSEPINNVDSCSNSNIDNLDGQPGVLNSVPFCSTVEETAKKLYHKVENVTKKAEQNVNKNLQIENENDAKNGSEPINSNDSITSNTDDDNLNEQPQKDMSFSLPLCSTIEENAKKLYQKVTKKGDKNLGNDEENGSEPTNSSDSSSSSNFDIDNSYGQPGILESSTILTSQPVLNNSKDELKVLFGPIVGEV